MKRIYDWGSGIEVRIIMFSEKSPLPQMVNFFHCMCQIQNYRNIKKTKGAVLHLHVREDVSSWQNPEIWIAVTLNRREKYTNFL
jgi:hypothetical protein